MVTITQFGFSNLSHLHIIVSVRVILKKVLLQKYVQDSRKPAKG